MIDEALILEDRGSHCQRSTRNPVEAAVSEHRFSKQGVARNQTSYSETGGAKVLEERFNHWFEVPDSRPLPYSYHREHVDDPPQLGRPYPC